MLKRLVGDLTLDKHILAEVIRKKSEPGASPRACTRIQATFQVSVRRACRLGCFTRTAYTDPVGRTSVSVFVKIAVHRLRFGYLHIHVMLRRTDTVFIGTCIRRCSHSSLYSQVRAFC